MTPSFTQAVELLGWAFGLVSNREDKLTVLNSFVAKQKRYQDGEEDAPTGLLPDLVLALGGGSEDMRKNLRWVFSQYENLLAFLRTHPLFTERTQVEATYCFLWWWVYPQVAAFLYGFREAIPPDSPLFYLEDLLPSPQDEDYQPLQKLKVALKAMIPPEIDATGFRTAVDKLSPESARKAKSIRADITKLKESFPAQQAGRAAEVASKALALYTAGIAVQRFAELAAGQGPSSLPIIRHHLAQLAKQHIKAKDYSLAAAHGFILTMLVKNADPDYAGSKVFQQVLGRYEGAMASQDPGDDPDLKEALQLLFVSRPPDIEAARARLEAFRGSERYALYEPVALACAGQLALAEGDFITAKARFLEVVAAARSRQLGSIAFMAAGQAIALTLLLSERVPSGRLEPLVSARIEHQAQKWSLELGHETPFSKFSINIPLDISKRTILHAVRDFNKRCVLLGNGGCCNLLAKLNGMMAAYFAARDHAACSVEAAVDKAFSTQARSRSVLAVHTAPPYAALRDIAFYFSQCFDTASAAAEANPALQRYRELPDEDKRAILQALDAHAFAEDAALTSAR